MTADLVRAIKLAAITIALVVWWATQFGQSVQMPLLGLCVLMCGLVIAVDVNARRADKRAMRCHPPGQLNAEKAREVRKCLRKRLGDETFTSWFNALEFEDFDGSMVTMSVPVKFLCNYIHAHYFTELRECCLVAFPGSKYARVVARSLKSPDQ